MRNKSKYLLEIVTDELPISELNDILKILHHKFLNHLLKNNIKILLFFLISYIFLKFVVKACMSAIKK